MKAQDVLALDAEYVRYAPVLEVATEARRRAYEDMRNDPDGIVGEQLAEIGSERALGGSYTAMDDARRIWVFDRVYRAVRRFADAAPAHADAAEDFINGLPL